MIAQWYAKAGLIPPQTDTIAKWFYSGKPPDWAIALLVNDGEKFFAAKLTNVQLLRK